MNVREMLAYIPAWYPEAALKTEFSEPPHEYFQVLFPNGWIVGVGYGSGHYSSNRLYHHDDPLDAITVELCILQPDGRWYIPESADMEPESKTAVLGWQDSYGVFRILEYVSRR